MADKGIIFSGPMVRALLDGRKTQTRRLIKPVTDSPRPGDILASWPADEVVRQGLRFRPGYAVGDRLYVRENFCAHWEADDAPGGHRIHRGIVEQKNRPPIDLEQVDDKLFAFYQASNPTRPFEHSKWRPCIHMPRWASRIWLEVTQVRVDRVYAITNEDAIAEGLLRVNSANPVSAVAPWTLDGSENAHSEPWAAFSELWNSLHDKPGERFDDGPWIVAITFTVNKGNIDDKPVR